MKALIFGELCAPPDRGDEAVLPRLLAELAPGIPIVTGLPFGHGERNDSFPLGVEVELDTRAGCLWWRA